MKPFKIDENYYVDNDNQRDLLRKELSTVEDIKDDVRVALLIGSIDVRNDGDHVRAIKTTEINDIVDSPNFISVLLYHQSLTIHDSELGYCFETDRRIFLILKK